MQKLYYSISEVRGIVDEEQHILRYWEKEFDLLKPKKNRGGNRIYSEDDLNIVKTIKLLLRHEKLSLKGAKEQLKRMVKNDSLVDFLDKFNINPDNEEVEIETTNSVKLHNGVKIQKDALIELYNCLKDTVEYLKSI